MAEKKNPIAAMIVAKAKPMNGEPDGDEQEDGDSEGRRAAAEDIMQALDKRDPDALMQALHAFVTMC